MKHLDWYKNEEKRKLYRRHQNKVNYANGNFIVKSHRRFDDQEDWEVLYSDKTDRQIAKELQRSTKSIQLRRHKILSGKVQSAYSQERNVLGVG